MHSTLPTLAFIVPSLVWTVTALGYDWTEWKISEGGNGHLYALTEPGSWPQVAEWATLAGGCLITIDEQAENDWLVATFPQTPLWIGLYQPSPGIDEPAGGWVWAGGAPATYTNWYPGQPDNLHGFEHHAETNYMQPGAWNDQVKYVEQPGLIEIPEPSALALLAFVISLQIPRRPGLSVLGRARR